jgi:hypothetical protein
METLQMLSRRNPVLYYAGLISLLLGLTCILISFFDHRQIMGINAWIKPIKFFISISIFTWKMAFYLSLLPTQRTAAIRWYSWMAVLVFAIELLIITGQAARGQLSHFNVSSAINGMLFSLMGIAIVTLTVWTAIAGTWFWRSPIPQEMPAGFLWGIRLGIFIFVIFSFEGMVIAQRLQHTIGAPDGGDGLPIVNWSKQHGDLRVAHFVGMHALQVLPLLGYYMFKRPLQITVVSFLYTGFALWLFLRALSGKGIQIFS